MFRNIVLTSLAALLITVPQVQAEDRSQAQKQEEQAKGQPEAATGQQQPGKVEFVGMLEPGQWITTDFIGKEIVNSSGEPVGSVKALLVGGDNRVVGAIIGVGGFLGIGEKHVAINFDAISPAQDQSGDTRLVANVAREQLETAPELKGRDSGTMQKAEEKAREAGEQVEQAASDVKEMGDEAARKVEETGGEVAEKVEEMGDEGAQKVEEAAEKTEDAAETAREEVSEEIDEQTDQQR